MLTPALAGVNPKAYTAHFKRLGSDAQRHYLSTLTPPELRTHFKTVGENATVGLFLTVSVSAVKLEATVAGSALGEAVTALDALQSRAIALGTEIEAKVVSGMLTTTLGRLERTEAVLRELRWNVKTVVLAGDAGGGGDAPALGWSMRGTIGEWGTFYMPNESLRWEEREVIRPMLEALAQRCGAVLDVRL
ncbi:MAG: hypothetical protein JNM17_08305 [Archangium sp.]|nr:hypothetical protein [Archangium sp.]